MVDSRCPKCQTPDYFLGQHHNCVNPSCVYFRVPTDGTVFNPKAIIQTDVFTPRIVKESAAVFGTSGRLFIGRPFKADPYVIRIFGYGNYSTHLFNLNPDFDPDDLIYLGQNVAPITVDCVLQNGLLNSFK